MKLWRFELKPVDNTKWDYVVPLGLAFLASFYYVFYLWNCFDCSLTRRISTPEDLYPVFIVGVIVLLILSVSTFYSTRKQRIFLSLFIIGLVIFQHVTLNVPDHYWDIIYHPKRILFFLGLTFGMGNLSLYMKFGGSGIKAQGMLRSSLGWGIFGFGLHGATGALGCPRVGQLFCATHIAKYDILTRVLHYTQYDEFPNSLFLWPTGYITNFVLFSILGAILELYRRKRRSAK